MNEDRVLEDEPGRIAADDPIVRELRTGDLARVVKLDRDETGLDRRAYIEGKVRAALGETGIRVSLAAEVDGTLVGFVLGQVFQGEYGEPATVASIDTIGVDPAFRGRGIGRALMAQLALNLEGLRVDFVRTEADWSQWPLLSFLASVGFRPSQRLCLELPLRRGGPMGVGSGKRCQEPFPAAGKGS